MDKYSYISNADVGYIDQLYQDYKQNPAGVDPTWQKFFEGYEFSTQRFGENGHIAGDGGNIKETQVRALIFAYRSFGHLKSNTNPVRERRDHGVKLDHITYGLADTDLDTEFDVAAEIGMPKSPLRKIIERLKNLYLGTIGFEY